MLLFGFFFSLRYGATATDSRQNELPQRFQERLFFSIPFACLTLLEGLFISGQH